MINFDERWLVSVVFRRHGSVAPRALWFALPSACLAPLLLILDDLAPGALDGLGLEAVASSVLWSSTTACVFFLVGFRSRQALGRFWEGTGLLHQMRGEWFDAASCLMTFSRGARSARAEEVSEFRHAFVRLMSLMHGSALEEIKCGNHRDVYEVIDIRGLDSQTRSYLRECKDEHGFNRVEVLLHMVQVLITQNLDDGVLQIAPPILSRVYQTLSRGLVNLLDARKITVTKFPFPYVQLITILLIFHSLITPVVIAAIVQHKVWASLFTFMPVFGLFSLNFIAIELEVPFGDDDNDLPLELFQTEMNSSLLMLLSDEADHLVHTSHTAVKNIRGLTKSLSRSFTTTLDRGSFRQAAGESTCASRLAPELEFGGKASTVRSTLPGLAVFRARELDCAESIFNLNEVGVEAAAEADLRPEDEICIDQMSTSREPAPSRDGEQEANAEQQTDTDSLASGNFVVRSRTLIRRLAPGSVTSMGRVELNQTADSFVVLAARLDSPASHGAVASSSIGPKDHLAEESELKACLPDVAPQSQARILAASGPGWPSSLSANPGAALSCTRLRF